MVLSHQKSDQLRNRLSKTDRIIVPAGIPYISKRNGKLVLVVARKMVEADFAINLLGMKSGPHLFFVHGRKCLSIGNERRSASAAQLIDASLVRGNMNSITTGQTEESKDSQTGRSVLTEKDNQHRTSSSSRSSESKSCVDIRMCDKCGSCLRLVIPTILNFIVIGIIE
ncbi:BgTH12-01057 [Blumeria graminis f. sp. triticale]|uniref:BgTH12-01057 n=1 Tax=Blumeria graminis f. sp. triticale TaxID=1689686 RepID=A0A9W4GHF3_BLUGR|nr:BgTH12-01057 [Blumeria graminis f. sp. triticale]